MLFKTITQIKYPHKQIKQTIANENCPIRLRVASQIPPNRQVRIKIKEKYRKNRKKFKYLNEINVIKLKLNIKSKILKNPCMWKSG